MTNEVEKLIIENHKETNNIKYEQNVAYLFYKEIWKFILFVHKYDYNSLLIKFKIIKKDNKYYISEVDGINYKIINSDFNSTWNTFYEGCEEYYIKNILNTNIDYGLLIKLLYLDGFHYDYLEDEDKYMVFVEIDKHTINKNISSILLKNKILKKEM